MHVAAESDLHTEGEGRAAYHRLADRFGLRGRATRAGPPQRQLPGDLEHHAVLRATRTPVVVVPPVLEPPGAPDPVTLSAAAVFSLLPVLRARRQAAQQAYRDSPVAYLLRLEEELTPQTTPARAGHWVRRFVTGIETPPPGRP
jgi:hypothetical protein